MREPRPLTPVTVPDRQHYSTCKLFTGGPLRWQPVKSDGTQDLQWNPKAAPRLNGMEAPPQRMTAWHPTLDKGQRVMATDIVLLPLAAAPSVFLVAAFCWIDRIYDRRGRQRRAAEEQDNLLW